ncbi:hypothetical protein ATKI12_8882 [Kitasatospora sp. Ki12]
MNAESAARRAAAVRFADPRSPVIDIVQAVGRALRQSYRQGKVSWVVIPVHLPAPPGRPGPARCRPPLGAGRAAAVRVR